jgi:transcriptional regulator GlxA family with amidase domain
MMQRPKVIAFLVGSPGDLMNLVSIAAVFSYPQVDGKPGYITKILSTDDDGLVQGRDGLTIGSSTPYREYVGPIDTLVVIGGESAFIEPSPDVVAWIRKHAPDARRIVAVCTGVFVLAPTGLLDGRRLTTHWHHSHRLAQLYPKFSIQKDSIFVKDGNIYSTAGVTAGIDLALSLVEEDFGHRIASSIAHTLVLYVRRSGNEDQYSTLLAQQIDVSGTPMRHLPAWAKSRLAQRLDVTALAKAVTMTPRTFARRFASYFRTTPARWIQSLRLEAACAHVVADELPLKTIAGLTGFRNEQAMRRAFLQQLDMTPKEYRERFGPSLREARRQAFEVNQTETKAA